MTREKPPEPVVLIVDDEPLIRWSLSERIAEDGYPVRVASTGLEARHVLASLVGQRVVILLDIRLPDVDDLSLFRQIRADRPDVPVILLTAHGTPEDARTAIAEGAFRFVSKPFDMAAVATVVAEAGKSF